MDKCLRILLCLSFLLFLEQRPATPKPLKKCLSLSLKELGKVECNSTLTFASPIFQESCMAAAERTFKEGLLSAIKMKCKDDGERLNDTLLALNECKIQDQNSVECRLKQKTFPEFVAAFQKFIEYNNTLNN